MILDQHLSTDLDSPFLSYRGSKSNAVMYFRRYISRIMSPFYLRPTHQEYQTEKTEEEEFCFAIK